MLDECLRRWTAQDLAVEVRGPGGRDTPAWIVWHLIEHDLHHSGAISHFLGTNGIPSLEL